MAIEPLENFEDDFPPDIVAAFDNYPAPNPSKGFEALFWKQLDSRRSRYRGFSGLLRRLWELEIEGVVVWRLAASTITGGLSCALLLSLATGSVHMPSAPSLPPSNDAPVTNLNAYAFYRREWEADSITPRPKSPVTSPQPTRGGELSWNDSNAHLA